MSEDYFVYYVNDWEYSRAIETNKRIEPNYTPHLMLRIIRHYNENVFDGFIYRGATFNIENCLNDHDSNTIAPIFFDGKNAILTYNGRTFFKIINIATGVNPRGIYTFKFQYINGPTFSEKNTAFMLMPFAFKQLNDFYEKNIKNYLKECDLNIEVLRSDDITGSDVVADTILKQIKKAEFIICDITKCNKNVFFEVGYAQALNKDIIFLLERNKPVEFFDVNHIRRIEYSFGEEEDFQKILRETLISLRKFRVI